MKLMNRPLQKSLQISSQISSRLSPTLAAPILLKILCYPGVKRKTKPEKFPADFKFCKIEFEDRKIATWSWQAPHSTRGRILLVHGWGGFAGQMTRLVQPLLAAGYSVTVYDQPAHGESDGCTTTLPEWTRLIRQMKKEFPDIRGLISHSYGGLAAAYEISTGLEIEAFVTVGSPSSPLRMVQHFVSHLNLDPRMTSLLIKQVEGQEQIEFEDYELTQFGADLKSPTLVIHDQDDIYVPVSSAIEWQSQVSAAQLMITQGLGHHAILKDSDVHDRLIGFLNQFVRPQS